MTKELEPFCFWCGGNARFDFTSEPRPFYANPGMFCQNCLSVRGEGGILVFEVVDNSPGCNNPVLPGWTAYYTGRWTVIDAQIAEQIFPPPNAQGAIEAGVACLRHDNYAKAGFNKYPWRTIQ